VTERLADRTGYYFNRELPRLALVRRGVRVPPGRWVYVADGEQPPWRVQEMAAGIVSAEGGSVPFVALLTDSDVEEFEKELGAAADPR
jgi:hypothetical protein